MKKPCMIRNNIDIKLEKKYRMNQLHTPLDWINMDKLEWSMLSGNPNAIDLLEKNPEKINWRCLSLNSNAIHLLEKNPEKICWSVLCRNLNALPLQKPY